jgi:DNA ligase (NAD+)
MPFKIEKKIESLREKIREQDYKYYVLTQPGISDYEYDKLVKELEKYESEHPELITEDSPTQRVGKDLNKEFKPIHHKVAMLSLANTYNEDELYDFDRRVKDALQEGEKIEYIVEFKIDGASVSLNYVDGKLKTAATRGDGTVGEEITNNVKTMRTIPLTLNNIGSVPYKLNDFEVRGEIFINIKDFEKLNEERAEQGENLFANPRNSTAGTLKMQDPRIVASRPLNSFMYSLISLEDDFKSQEENLILLKQLGFKVNTNHIKCNGIEEVIKTCRRFEDMRNKLDYEIDGAVVKLNSIEGQNILGNIAKSPRWAVAFKFKAKQANTFVKKITWQVGRTGALTPVAELEPIFLAGSTISRATLHNFDEIQRKDIRVGDKVVLEKGGDVIPKVVSVVLIERRKGSRKTKPPEKCPTCNSKLFKPEEEVAYYCENPQCSDQVKGRIEHFTSRGAMDIEGLGTSLVDIFVDKGFLYTYADIYKLKIKRNELIALDRMGEKRVDNLLKSIEESKKQPFEKVLFAIGIRYVGAGVAKKLADHFLSIEALMNAADEKISAVHEIGESISKSVAQFFKKKTNLKIISELKEAGLNFKSVKKNSKETSPNFFSGKSFVLTGTLISFTRGEAGSLIEGLGGNVTSNVSNKTDYVLAGEKAGSKLDKAKALGIEIIEEEDFNVKLGEADIK